MLALVVTSYNTSGKVGLTIPLILGAAFVAILIPVTLQHESEISTMTAILTGLAVNAFEVGVIVFAWTAWKRLTISGKR